ncbi:transposase family protein [Nostoc sp. UHCC 0302]|uniref:transposase family protein n=1 Tax=Nostoc sp. UHCC 0302 TaxID=3134896 RepID=UPI00311CC541
MLNSILIAVFPRLLPRATDLSTPERHHNRNLAQLRVIGEHINRRLKIFRILKEQYRNRRRRFALRCNLIAGLLNYELALFS